MLNIGAPSSLDGAGELERLIHSLGGTFFSNVISSAPDTPRSLGIFFTGKKPCETGIDRRSRYPGPFLSSEDSSIFSSAIPEDVAIRVVTRKLKAATLMLPQPIQERADFYFDVAQIPARKDSPYSQVSELIFVIDTTYHITVGQRHSHKSAHRVGSRAVAENIERTVSALQLTLGDELFLFSDHGCKLSHDKLNSAGGDLSRDRSQIVFYNTKFQGEALTVISDLYAMEDVHTLVIESLRGFTEGIKSKLDFPPPRAMVHVEDHDGWATGVGYPVNQWAVFNPKFEYFEEKLGFPILVMLENSDCSAEEALEMSQSFLAQVASNYEIFNREYDSLTKGFSRVSRSQEIEWKSRVNAFRKNPWMGERVFWTALSIPFLVSRKLSSFFSQKIGSRKHNDQTGSNQRLAT